MTDAAALQEATKVRRDDGAASTQKTQAQRLQIYSIWYAPLAVLVIDSGFLPPQLPLSYASLLLCLSASVPAQGRSAFLQLTAQRRARQPRREAYESH